MMKTLYRAGMVLALASLTACASTGGGVIPADALNTAKKGLALAHDAHAAAAYAASAAANSGLCVGSCASQAKNLLDQSENYLKVADSAVALGDASTIEQDVAAADAIIAQVQTLTKGH